MNSEWIGINERMPGIGQKILGYTSFNIIVCTAMRIYLDGGLDILRDYLNEHDLLWSDDCGKESERHLQAQGQTI